MKLCELPSVMVAVLGEIVMWSSWAEFAVTVRDAVSDRLPFVAFTVHVPAFSDVYVAPVHEPPAPLSMPQTTALVTSQVL